MHIDDTNQTSAVGNQHITEHEQMGDLFIREINHPELPRHFQVLNAETGEYAGNVSNGSDCTFETHAEAMEWMRRAQN